MTLLKDYQPIEYPDESLLEKCQLELSQKSPLISIQEINHLKDLLVEVHCQRGPPQLIVQFGHCAETFSNNSYASFLSFAGLFEKIKRKLQKRNIQLIPILRMAGQFAKPRTFLHEEVSSEDGTFIVPTYRGDLVNGPAIHERIPNPERLLRAYEESNLALQYIKDAFVCESIFTMHEFLSLPYEKALIRSKVHGGKYSLNSSPFSDTLVSHTAVYSSSAHALWLGDRTAFSDSVHTHLLAGIENPIGIKVGPSKSPKSILEILDILNPTKVLGKIMLITRFGAQNVSNY